MLQSVIRALHIRQTHFSSRKIVRNRLIYRKFFIDTFSPRARACSLVSYTREAATRPGDFTKGRCQMKHVFIEPMPKGRWGPIDGYALEFQDGTRVTDEVYQSEKRAVSEIKLRGYMPMIAKVRITDKEDTAHWELTV
jgi:hypothetical protein